MKCILLSAILTLEVIAGCAAELWAPTSSPLATRWKAQVSPQNVHAEYPRPQMVRNEWQNLNGAWQLVLEDSSTSGVGKPPREISGTPVLVPFPIESALSGVGKHSHHVWYRRSFEVPAEWRNRRTILNFEAVDWEAHVYVNGKKIGEHRGGYDPFSFDITDALKPEGPQELVVGVYDPSDQGTQPRGKQVEKPRGIWYTPSTGIWQTVWMEPVEPGAIDQVQLTPDPEANKLAVALRTLAGEREDDVQWTLLDGTDTLASGTLSPGEATISLPQGLQRWSAENPKLYDLRLSLIRNGTSMDEVVTYFGLRKVEIRQAGKFQRIFLNGKEIFQVGTLDQGFWPESLHTAPTDEALRWDIEQTKKLGFNMIRKHIKVEPARWYYWTDKLGMLVWQDMPSGKTNQDAKAREVFELELKRMIDSRRFSPSIIMWVVFNEGWGQFDAEGTGRVTKWVKEMDRTRLVNSASGWHDYGTGDIADMHMYPGPGAPRPEKQRASVLGEFGGLGLPTPGHMWSKENWGYQGTSSKENLTNRYEQLLRGVYRLKEEQGLCAAVYTQITDVETETNGLITYDRQVMKVIPELVFKANRGESGPVVIRKVVPTAEDSEVKWRYTNEKPPEEWMKPGFDDSGWKEGLAGFGQKETSPLARTDWLTTSIYLRREFDLPSTASLEHLYLSIFHDGGVEVYLNGEQAARENEFRMSYGELPIGDRARATLKPGKNLLAVSCGNLEGGQYIDVGLVTIEEATEDEKK